MEMVDVMGRSKERMISYGKKKDDGRLRQSDETVAGTNNRG